MSIVFTPEGYKRARKVLLPFASEDDARHHLSGIALSKNRANVPVLFSTNGHVLRVIAAGACGVLEGYPPDLVPFVIPRDRLPAKPESLAFAQNYHGTPVSFEQVIPRTNQRTLRVNRAALEEAVRDLARVENEAAAVRWATWDAKRRSFREAQAADNDKRRRAHAEEKARFEANYQTALRDWEGAAKTAKLNGQKAPPKPPEIRPARFELANALFEEPEPRKDAFVGFACEGEAVALVAMRFVTEESGKKIKLRAVEHARVPLDPSVALMTFAKSAGPSLVLIDARYLTSALRSFDAAEIAIGLSGELDPVDLRPWDPPAGAVDVAVVMPVRQ